MKTRILIPLLLFLWVTPYTHVFRQDPDIDLQTFIAGIKHFDAAVTWGTGEFVYDHRLGTGQMNKAFSFTFGGVTFENAQVRVDFDSDTPDHILGEIYDGEREWEVYAQRKLLFSVDISPTDYERLNKAKRELRHSVKQRFKEIGIHISVSDFRIETEDESSYSKMIDTVTGDRDYIYYTEEYFSFYEPHLEYGVGPGCMIHAPLDPRYWMAYGLATPSGYVMTSFWKVLEDNETDFLQTEMLNGEETYLVRVKRRHVKSLKLWVSAEKGFGLVKLQGIEEVPEEIEWLPFKKGEPYITERHIHYREYLPGVWFPENVVQTIHPLLADTPERKGELMGKTTLQAVSCELNVDVCWCLWGQFQLDVPEDTPVFDHGVGKLRPYGELKQRAQ